MPVVVAKGQGFTAEKIKKVVESGVLKRIVNRLIISWPWIFMRKYTGLYAVVAEILAYYRMDKDLYRGIINE